MPNPMPNEMFKKINVPSEKKRIFKALVDKKEVLLLKGSDDSVCRLSPQQLSKENTWLACTLLEGKLEGFNQQVQEDSHIVNFGIDEDRYFFQTSIQMNPENILLDSKVDLYQLQRRKSIRLPFPEEMTAVCSIINLNSFSGLYICHIADYSTGGLRLEYAAGSPTFAKQDQLVCILKFGHRSPFEMKAEIKHCFDPKDHKGVQIFGIEFKDAEKINHNKLVSLQLDLQSEIFRKWKRHQY